MRTTLLLAWGCAAALAAPFGCATKEPPTSPSGAQPKAAAAKSPAQPAGQKARPAASQEAATKGGLTVHEAVACKSVKERAPVEPGEVFGSDVGRVYLFTKVGIEGDAEASIQHIWYFNGTKVGTVTLPARGDSWRTYSSKSIQKSQAGEWKVDIANAAGEVARTVSFRVE